MRISCCIVAAGQGKRLGDEWADTPKALVPVLGRPMLYYSLHALCQVEGIHNLVIAVPLDAIEEFREEVKLWGFSRPFSVLEGGATRAASVLNALKALADNEPDGVLIHDAARACLTPPMVEALLAAWDGNTAATLAHWATDTLRMVDRETITDEIDRSSIACLETPQVFAYARLLELHMRIQSTGESLADLPPASPGGRGGLGGGELPDDTTLFSRLGEKVQVVIHRDSNLKITYPEDIASAEGILFARGWQDASEEE